MMTVGLVESGPNGVIDARDSGLGLSRPRSVGVLPP